MTPLRITHVEGNLKGLKPIDLGPVTFIVGPHQSGKSSVLQAIWLAWYDELLGAGKEASRALYSTAAKVRAELATDPSILMVTVDTTLGRIGYTNTLQRRRTLSAELQALEADPKVWSSVFPVFDGPLAGPAVLSDLVRNFWHASDRTLSDVLLGFFGTEQMSSEHQGDLWERAFQDLEPAPLFEQLLALKAWMTNFKSVKAGRGIGALERQMAALLETKAAYRPGRAEEIQQLLDQSKLAGVVCSHCHQPAEPGARQLSPVEHDTLRAELARQQAAATAQQQYEKLRLDADVLRIDQARAKGLEGELQALVSQAAAEAAGAAQTGVQLYMPDGLEGLVEVFGNVAAWGVRPAGGRAVWPGAMSGMEEASVRVAKALLESSWAPYRIVLLDDAALGGIRGAARVSMLVKLRLAVQTGVIGQLIVASTEDTGATLADTVVRLGS